MKKLRKTKTYEQRKYNRKQTLGEYLYKEIAEHQGDEDVRRTRPMTWPSGLYFTSDDLECWIQQYKIKEGHSEWSEKYQKNIWIEDED